MAVSVMTTALAEDPLPVVMFHGVNAGVILVS